MNKTMYTPLTRAIRAMGMSPMDFAKEKLGLPYTTFSYRARVGGLRLDDYHKIIASTGQPFEMLFPNPYTVHPSAGNYPAPFPLPPNPNGAVPHIQPSSYPSNGQAANAVPLTPGFLERVTLGDELTVDKFSGVEDLDQKKREPEAPSIDIPIPSLPIPPIDEPE